MKHDVCQMERTFVCDERITIFYCLSCLATKAVETKFTSNFEYLCTGKTQKLLDPSKKK